MMKIFHFIQGWTRYYMYYGEYRNTRLSQKAVYLKETTFSYVLKWNSFIHNLLPLYIRNQIQIRIKSSLDCIMAGQCKICKCSTPALQMADKACDKPCYPAMINKKEWEEFYGNGEFTPRKWYYDKSTSMEWSILDGKFISKENYILNKFHKTNE